MSRALDGHVAIVTGGASGIGLAIARALAAEEAVVVIADLDGEGAARAAATIARAEGVAADVASESDAQRVADGVIERYGRVDILVNNAGYVEARAFLELAPADWDRMLAVHARGTFLFSQAAARHMVRRGYGRIVNVSSGGAIGLTGPHTIHYHAAKAAQALLGKGMALALGAHGITVNSVVPSTVETPLWERVDRSLREATGKSARQELDERAAASHLGRVLRPEEVARVVCFLCLPDSEAITGEVISIGT